MQTKLEATQQMAARLLAPSGFLACCNRRTPIDAVNRLVYTFLAIIRQAKCSRGILSNCRGFALLTRHYTSMQMDMKPFLASVNAVVCCIHTSIARGLDGEADSASGRQLLSHKPPQPTVVSTSTSQVARSLHSLVLKLSPR